MGKEVSVRLSKKLTYEVVYDELKHRIQDGVWKPGERLPTIEELSIQLNVGISSIREAVRILNKQKILRVEQGRGTYVREEIPEGATKDHLAFLENASWVQLTEARLVIEPQLAGMASVKASQAELDALVANARLMQKKVKNGLDFLKEDMEFHRLIAKASHNEVLYNMLEVIGDLLLDSRRHTMRIPGMDDKAAAYHTLIADAIAQRNQQQAIDLMRLHIQDMLDHLHQPLQKDIE
jgi:GntR family transcriptional repressor for pyruvate dehydrogenase complex